MASRCTITAPDDPASLLGPPTVVPPNLAPWGAAEIHALRHTHRWQFSPRNASADGWKDAIYRSQFRANCDRLLLVEDDLTKAGMGFTAKLWTVALLVAMKDNRVLVEVRMVKQGNATRSDGFERPRWCDRPPYTLQCLYAPWTHCAEPGENATVIRPGGRPLKTNKWPHNEPYIRTGLGRLHRQGLFWYGAKSAASREAGRFLFRPRPWVAAQAECVMRDAGLVPRSFLSVHIRHSVEKQKEGAKLGVALPSLDAYGSLSAALAADTGIKQVFLQTASPVGLEQFADFCRTKGLQLAYTNNSRSENDAWGGWKGGSEMEQAAVGAINAHIGSLAAVSVSPELSLWTQFLGWTFDGPPRETLGAWRICCPSTCRQNRGGSRMLQAFAAERLLHDGLATTRKDCNAHYQGTIGNLYENGKLVTVQSSTQTP
jgi:hypothetical protein